MPSSPGSARKFARYERRLRKWFPVLERLAPPLAHRLAAHIFFKPFRFHTPTEELQVGATARKFWFTVGDLTLTGYEWGKGPVVIFMHGWSGRGLQVREFVGPLTNAGFKVMAFDAPGHGASDGSTSDITAFSDALVKLAAKKGPVYALIGHSLGGAACLFSIKHSFPVQKVVVISTPAVAPDIKAEFLRRIGGKTGTGDFLEKYIFKRYGHSLEEFSARHSAKGILPVPVLLIYDADDPEVPVYHGKELESVLPNTEMMLTEKLGHTRILRDPGVVKRVVEFLAL